MSHQDHPGHCAENCHARITINRAAFSPTTDGYSCKITGGHCLPSDKCPKMLEELKKHRNYFDEDDYLTSLENP